MNSISVAMATFNGEEFILQQLESIASQTRLPAELVVTDDTSDDNTVNIVEEFAKIAPFPVYIYRNSKRLGYRANFINNVGLCKYNIVALCDQDDVLGTQ